MARYVFVTGGVVSSLGKGLSSASLAALLQLRGFKVRVRKLDPYLNVDPGTMNPFQHGEVFVTDDGAETDLDIGHYERFTGISATKSDNITTGGIYSDIIKKERKGDYLGGTVQVVPHVTDRIKKFISHNIKDEDFVVSEKKKITKDDLIENTISLDASVVASLFEDLNYDLSKIRKGKKVKPFYISLLPKDISLIDDIGERKELFIKIVLPLILQENEKIKEDREKLFKVLAKKSNSKQERNWLKWKFKEYKIKNSDISELKIRMDIVPVSLAIAQAAIESGWGTSRFALEGNALYGQWTWSDNGLKPLDNDDDQNHKVMRFKILTASIKAYKKNLNTHSGYAEFREARANLRNQNEKVTGLKLTQYLDKYSAQGKKYTEILKATIKKNSLSDFENAKLLSTGLRKEIKL